MCREPAIRAPRSGRSGANSSRIAINPGISVSAMAISLRPQPARSMSATLKSVKFLTSVVAFMRHSVSSDSGGGTRLVLVTPRESRFNERRSEREVPSLADRRQVEATAGLLQRSSGNLFYRNISALWPLSALFCVTAAAPMQGARRNANQIPGYNFDETNQVEPGQSKDHASLCHGAE